MGYHVRGYAAPIPPPVRWVRSASTARSPRADDDVATRASGAYVTFSPGARTVWHTHPLGQTLVVTAGVGRVQRWGGPIEEIRPGDVVRIPLA